VFCAVFKPYAQYPQGFSEHFGWKGAWILRAAFEKHRFFQYHRRSGAKPVAGLNRGHDPVLGMRD
jgi:hypothetical protein